MEKGLLICQKPYFNLPKVPTPSQPAPCLSTPNGPAYLYSSVQRKRCVNISLFLFLFPFPPSKKLRHLYLKWALSSEQMKNAHERIRFMKMRKIIIKPTNLKSSTLLRQIIQNLTLGFVWIRKL